MGSSSFRVLHAFTILIEFLFLLVHGASILEDVMSGLSLFCRGKCELLVGWEVAVFE